MNRPNRSALIPFALLGALSVPASAEWRRLGDADLRDPAKNLARTHLGAQLLEGSSGPLALGSGAGDANDSALSLLSDDPSVGFPIAAGETSIEFSLAEVEALGSIGFANASGSGKITVYTALTGASADSERWREAGFAIFDPERRDVRMELGGVDARRVKLVFQMARPGRVYGFGLFGDARSGEFSLHSLRDGADVSARPAGAANDVATSVIAPYSGARIAYVSSGAGDPTALVDGDATTTYRFSPDDPAPTVVFDLGEDRQLGRAAALLDPGTPVASDFYVLSTLPESQDWIGRTALDPAGLEGAASEGTAEGESGRLSQSFGATAPARYAAFRLEVLGGAGEGLEVSELAAFSPGLSSSSFVARSEWAAKGVIHGKAPRSKNPIKGQYAAYSGPLADYSGANYMRRGSGGLARAGGGSTGGREVVTETVTEVVTEVVRETETVYVNATAPHSGGTSHSAPVYAGTSHGGTAAPVFEGGTSHGGGGGPVVEGTAVVQPTYAPVVQVVSRIAVSVTTVPGVGHLYYNAGAEAAPEGYTFESPAFAGTHTAGVIQPEIWATYEDTEAGHVTAPGQVSRVERVNTPGSNTAAPVPGATLAPVLPVAP